MEVATNVDTIHSGIKQLLSEIQANDEVDDDDLLRECAFHLQGKVDDIIQQYSDVTALGDHDFGRALATSSGSGSGPYWISRPRWLDVYINTYLENLKGELSSVEAENANLPDEVENLMKGYLEDSIRLQSNLEGLSSSLEFIQSQEVV
ncbi:hypothetical protein Tco_0848713 [Tanacetum coccineum]